MQDLSSHGIVAIVRNTAGKFLLLEDAREPMRGCWAPPHGRCEVLDQSEEAGVMREVREETGLVVKPIRKLFTQAADTKVKTVSFWLVELKSVAVQLDAESSRFGWFSLDEALQLKLYPGTKIFLEKLKRGEVRLD